MAAEVSSTLVRSVPDEATSSCPEPDYSAKKHRFFFSRRRHTDFVRTDAGNEKMINQGS